MRPVASFLFSLGLLLALALLPAERAGAESPVLAPIPAWVDDLPDVTALATIGEDDPAGTRHLLHDTQFTWADGRRQIWQRDVWEIRKPDALDEVSSQIYDYDQSRADFALSRVSLWRDGEEITLTGTPQLAFESFDASGEANGRNPLRFALLSVTDLRPGDILDISVLRSSAPGLEDLEREAATLLEFPETVTLARVVVNWPAGWGFHHAPLPEAATLAEGPLPDGGTRYEFQLFNHIAPPAEENLPLWVDELAMLRVNADQDWDRITATLAPAYSGDAPLGPWEARLAELQPPQGQAASGREVMAALRMVQSELYNTDLPLLSGHIIARMPADIAPGEASAAEKARLLSLMLRRMGLKADVALASYTYGSALAKMPPSPDLFDTVMVRVEMEGRVWWLDPSLLAQDVALEAMTPAYIAYALPLTAGTTALEPVTTDPAAIWSADVRETWRFTPAGVFLDVTSEHRGEAADDLRYREREIGISDISYELFSYYELVFPGIVTVRDPDFSDDPAQNIVRLHERYFLPAAALRSAGLISGFPVTAEGFTSELPQGGGNYPALSERKWPMAGIAPGLYRHRVELSGKFGQLQPPTPLQLENPAFRYTMTGSAPTPGKLVLEWEFLANGKDIAVKDLRQVLNDAQTVYETTWQIFDLE